MTTTIKLNADNYPIKSVTVFKSNNAEIVRVFDVSLQRGQSNIQISHLPGSIDTESARVSGLGDAQLFDVVCSVGRGIEEVDPLSTSEVIRKLKTKKLALVKDRDALDEISDTMTNYSKTLVGDFVPPNRAEKFFESLLTRSQTLRSKRVDLQEEILQLTRQIDVLSSAEEKKQGKSDGEVTAVITTKQATEIELKLTYLVQNATWSAAYELHTTTDAGVPSPSVSLHYRARITQSTGEDWTGVALTLSTADMNLSTQRIPTLTPTKIRPPRGLFGGLRASANSSFQPNAPRFRFSAPSAPQGFFGQSQPAPPPTASAFGQPSSGADSGGFGFGQPFSGTSSGGSGQPSGGANTGGFGQPSSGANSGGFGQPSGGTNTGGFGQPSGGANTGGFGQPSSGASSGGFGQPSSGANTGGFGQPSGGTNTGGFGQPSGGANTGGFGQPSSGASSGGFGAFGQATNSSQVPSGAPQAPQQQGLFGQPSSTMPSLGDIFLNLARQQDVPEPQPAHGAPTPADDGRQAVDTATANNEATPIAEPAVVHESPLALTYRIEGASRVPSDGVPHQLAVAVLPFAVTLQHVAVPKVQPVAYLHATVRNTSDYRLLAGPVHAFVDDAFAARTTLPRDVAPGDTFHCTLGVDPATRIRYARTPRPAAAARTSSAFSEQWASTVYVSRTIVTNSHPFALRALVLRDAVPVSEDAERVNVVLRRPAALAELEQGAELEVRAEEGEEKAEGEEGGAQPERGGARRKVRWSKLVDGKGGRKEGLFEWVVDVGAGEEVTIETEWDIKAPIMPRSPGCVGV